MAKLALPPGEARPGLFFAKTRPASPSNHSGEHRISDRHHCKQPPAAIPAQPCFSRGAYQHCAAPTILLLDATCLVIAPQLQAPVSLAAVSVAMDDGLVDYGSPANGISPNSNPILAQPPLEMDPSSNDANGSVLPCAPFCVSLSGISNSFAPSRYPDGRWRPGRPYN